MNDRLIAHAREVRHDRAMQMSAAIWIAIGAGVIGGAVALLVFTRPSGSADMGSVSEQWMAEHRTGPVHDPQR